MTGIPPTHYKDQRNSRGMLQRSSSGVRGEGELPQGYLVVQGDICGVGMGGCSWDRAGGARDAAHHPTVPRTSLHNRKRPEVNSSSSVISKTI